MYGTTQRDFGVATTAALREHVQLLSTLRVVDVHQVDVAVSSAVVRSHISIDRRFILAQRLAMKHELEANIRCHANT